jgi:hypothetical protein
MRERKQWLETSLLASCPDKATYVLADGYEAQGSERKNPEPFQESYF